MRGVLTLLIILAALVAVFTLVSKTSAHTLTIPGAHRVASATAGKTAKSIKKQYPKERKPIWSVPLRNCSRHNAHTVDCEVRYVFPDRSVECDQLIRVKFGSSTSTRVRVTYPGSTDCRTVD